MLIVLTSLKAPVIQQKTKADMTLNTVLPLNFVDFISQTGNTILLSKLTYIPNFVF